MTGYLKLRIIVDRNAGRARAGTAVLGTPLLLCY